MPTSGELEIPADIADEGVLVVPSARDPAAALLSDIPPLRSIWECLMLEKGPPAVPHNGKSDGWRCCHCGEVFYPVHVVRATHLFSQEKDGFIAICKAIIPEGDKARCVSVMLLLLSCACPTPTFLSVCPQV